MLHYPRALVLLEPLLEGPQGRDQRQVIVEVTPIDVSWTSDEPGRASSAKVTIDWSTLPLHPHVVRDLRLTIFCADVGRHDRQLGVSDRAAARWIGFVDEARSEHSIDGDVVTLTARDYAGRLLDVRWQGGAVDARQLLSRILRGAVDQISGYSDLTIEVEDDIAPARTSGRSRWTPPRGASVWDVVVGIARECGQVATLDLDRLRITRPRGVEPERTALMLYGRNVESMDLGRNLNPVVRKVIEIRVLDPLTRELRSGRWPAKSDPSTPILVYPVTGSWSAAQLQQQARTIYEQWERLQIDGSLTTRAMADTASTDLVGLRSGDSLFVQMRTADRHRVMGMSEGDLAAWLEAHGTEQQVGRELARRWVTADQLQPLFYARRVTHNWSRDDGYRLSVDFGNVLSVG